ncbi:MAG: photosystem II reaction center PsbP family protein [Zoogloeaceae bacterium]|jgi:hypothetical protein|nr:photosystem II reaction center PsbP family protein [Zoogloeaceae bacterium]
MKPFKTPASWLLMLMLFGSLLSCSPENETVYPAFHVDGWETLDRPGYSIQYPPDWGLNQDGVMGTEFVMFAPEDSSNAFRENVNLITQPVTMNLEEYIEAMNAMSPQTFPNYARVSLEKARDASGERYEMVSTFDTDTGHIKNRQYFWVANGKAYTLTWTSTAERFDDTKETGEKILKSFRIK